MKGNTQAWPEAGPLEGVQLPEEAVVVVEVVVVEVVEAVVVEVLTVVVEEVVVEDVVVVEVVVVVVELAEGQVEGQKPYLSVTKLPPASTSVEHQAALWSTVAHSLYTTPLYLNRCQLVIHSISVRFEISKQGGYLHPHYHIIK